jgi:hypothetical protein
MTILVHDIDPFHSDFAKARIVRSLESTHKHDGENCGHGNCVQLKRLHCVLPLLDTTLKMIGS